MGKRHLVAISIWSRLPATHSPRQLFAAPFSVDVGGVNEVDPGFHRAIKDPPRLFLGGRDPLHERLRRSK
jgi:hypothetical protein